MRVLAVEDDPVQARVLQSALEAEGFQVVGTVARGEEVLERVSATGPDLVFMDIELGPGEDGVSAAIRLRREASVPVIFLTGHADAATLERARVAEPYGYLLKPLDPRYLRVTAEMALHKHRMEEERRELTERLQAALDEVFQLQGLLPVCAWCRRVRDDDGYWKSLESYVARHLSAAVTHGICTDCQGRHFPEAGDPRGAEGGGEAGGPAD